MQSLQLIRGGVGHSWVKARFIDIGLPNEEHKCGKTTRIFIPSKVQDNKFLLADDPDYLNRLENLSEKDKKALLYGDWNIFDGQYFTEFRNDIHVIEPIKIQAHWKKYLALDYGLDMLACLWIARDAEGNAYVYKELHKPNLIISEAAELIKEINNNEEYEYIYAPRDLWNRRQETGKSVADIFKENGLIMTQTSVDRVDGWLATKEWLKPIIERDIETGIEHKVSKLKIFNNCFTLIKHIPLLQIDKKNPNDASTEPHEVTHICDALRYFCVQFTRNSTMPREKSEKEVKKERAIRNFINFK